MYIPISNILFSKYTNGEEFIFKSNLQPYVGFYFVDKSNNVYTGKTYTSDSVELLRRNPNTSINSNVVFNGVYASLNPKTLPSLNITPDFIKPTSTDYTNGFMTRFILKPTISSQVNDFIEVKSDKYTSVIQDSDAKVLYKSVSLVWKLTGPLYDVYRNNIRIMPGIIDSNKRSIAEAEKFIPNLSLYFTDLIQFNKSQESLKTQEIQTTQTTQTVQTTQIIQSVPTTQTIGGTQSSQGSGY